MNQFLQQVVGTQPSRQDGVRDIGTRLVPAILGAVVGALVFRSHRVMGGTVGFATGGVAYPLITGAAPKSALSTLAASGVGVGAALLWKKHPTVGFTTGIIGTTALTYPLWKDGR